MDSQAGRVVVAYDGSPAAMAAVDWAAAEAQKSSLPLTVINVHSYPDNVPGMIGSPASNEHRNGAFRATAVEGAQRAGQVARLTDVTAVTEVGDQVGATLIDFSADADLLVVGTRGHGDLAGALLGSVAFQASAHARCPVVVVRGNSTPPGPDRPILVAVDASPGAEAALRYAVSAAVTGGTPLTIVSAYGDPATDAWAEANSYPPKGQDRTAFASIAQQNAMNVVATAEHLALDLHPDLLIRPITEEGQVIRVLAAAAVDCGLLVVGSRGRGALAALALGSISHGVIHRAPCPVAVIHADPAPAQPAPPARPTTASV